MSLRFRAGPFTLGRSGTRLSLWKKLGGVSFPLFGSNRRSFGLLRAGPFRWHFAGGASRSQQRGKLALPIRNRLYKCPHCGKYQAYQTNIIGRFTLRCLSCSTISKDRGVKNMGTFFHPVPMRKFTTKTPSKPYRPNALYCFARDVLRRAVVICVYGFLLGIVFWLLSQ